MSPRISDDRKIPRSECPHTDLLDPDATSDAAACQVCGEESHTRICMTCGTVTCCESQRAHDRDHFEETGHPFVKPHREPYDFLWCYECGSYLD